MTIDLLHVDLSKCFTEGQAYVACSRGRSAATMVVEGFSEDRIMTSDHAKQFYASLKDGKGYNPPTWEVVLQTEERMKTQYGGEKCKMCQGVCTVRLIKSGKYRGKWAVQCQKSFDAFKKTRVSDFNHTWRAVPAPQI